MFLHAQEFAKGTGPLVRSLAEKKKGICSGFVQAAPYRVPRLLLFRDLVSHRWSCESRPRRRTSLWFSQTCEEGSQNTVWDSGTVL